MTVAIRRNFCGWKRFKIILLSVVVLIILINFIVTSFSSGRRHYNLNASTLNSHKYNNSNWFQYGDASKYISIEVLSSKDRVRICVDDATVIDDSGTSSNRGLHVVVLNQYTGMVMAQRVFDTYMDDELLIEFLHSVSNGRIMIFAIKILDSNIDNVPVVIIAGNRADYLYRTIKSVLNARGVKRHMITIHIDGYYDEPVEVARLLGVRAVQHMSAIGDSINVGGDHISSRSSSSIRQRRVTQHYNSAFTNTFSSLFPQAEYVIILEDDLEVSIDIFSCCKRVY